MRIIDPVLVACDEISRDAQTNKASLIGIFDRLLVRQLPSELNICLYLSFYVENRVIESCPVHFVLHSPDASVSTLPPVDFTITQNRVEADVRLNQVPIFMAGLYRVALHVDCAEVCSARLNVEFRASSPPIFGELN